MARLKPHISRSNNFHIFQSAYRRYHSTETALLKILDDVQGRSYRGQGGRTAPGAGLGGGAPMKPTISTKLLFYRIIF